MKLIFQSEPNPLKHAQAAPSSVPKPYLRPNEPLPKDLKLKTHDTPWWNSISNPSALVKESDRGLLTKASASLQGLLPEDRNTPRIEELISNSKLDGIDLANSILQNTFGHHVRLQSSDRTDKGLKAYQAVTQIVAAAYEMPVVQSAMNVLGSGQRGTITLDIRDIDKFLKKMEPSDGAQIHGASEWEYRVELLTYGTPYNIHEGLDFFSRLTEKPSALTPKNPLEKLGIVLDHRIHIDSKTIQAKSPLSLQIAAYHITKMAYGPQVAEGVSMQLETKFKYGLPIQKGLFPGERGPTEQKSNNGASKRTRETHLGK